MMTCDHCNKRTRANLTSVQTLAATFWSPAEYEGWCPACIQQAEDDEARADALRDDEADRRRDERDGF